MEFRVSGTGNWETYHQVQLGTVKLERGRAEVVAHAADAPNGALLDLKAVRLLPVN